MLSKIGIFKVVVVASSSISLSSKTTGLPSPLRHHRAFHHCSVIITVTPLIAFALASSIACRRHAVRRSRAAAKCRQRHDVALPQPPQPPRCHPRAVRCHCSADAKLPPTLLCRAAATASPPPSCRRRPLSRCRHRCRAAAAAAPPFVGWLLGCCLPSDFVIACRHATINDLVAGRFRR